MLNVGVFGVGHLGKFHLNNWFEIEGVKVIGFFDPNNEVAKEVAEKYNLKRFLDEEKLSQISNIDILITHTAPDWCTPLNKIGFGGLVDSFSENDPTLKDELKEERELMSKIFNLIQKQSFVKNHYYGHFHRSDITLNNGCQHQLVDINEFVEFK